MMDSQLKSKYHIYTLTNTIRTFIYEVNDKRNIFSMHVKQMIHETIIKSILYYDTIVRAQAYDN